MNLLYKSTRDAEKTVTASQAILKGLAVTADYLYRFRFRSFRCRLVNSKR